jgi:hypothetical protein
VTMVKKVTPTLSVFVLAFALIGRATPAAAADGISVDAAYQFLWSSSNGSSTSIPAGFAAGVAIPLSSPWSIVGDFGWSRKSDTGVTSTATSIGGGLRYLPMTMSTFRPYAQAVVGVEMDKASVDSGSISVSVTNTNLMIQPGVGGMFGVGSLQAFVEGDYRRVQASGAAANDLVLRGGLVWTLGK